ncbi:MAG: dihydrofolate reductase [Brumimicrobium sp.]
MKKIILSIFVAGFLFSCSEGGVENKDVPESEDKASINNGDFQYEIDRFADIRILRYQVPEFEDLSLQQKKLVYYLTQAGMAGRDIIWDQNYKYNLEIRRVLENIVNNYSGEENSDWNNFMEYTKQVWFANGIHHHYSMSKFTPKFSESYFDELLAETETKISVEAKEAIFNPDIDNKRVNLDASKGLIPGSANNYYGDGVTDEMVDEYYKKIKDPNEVRPISYGLNSKMVLNDKGEIEEIPWKIGGMYGEALEQVVYWLDKATEVAENEAQAEGIRLLIKYYQTGDLKDWDAYCIAWAEATEGDIDYINGFVEVYGDAKGYRGAYESVVQIKDFHASEQMKVLEDNVQWFEDNSPILDEHKKEKVTGVTYKVVSVAGESGDASPATPIGINLPNSDWIREEHGSKSVSLGNIISAYNNASAGSLLSEFAYTEEEAERARKYYSIGDDLHTALHEVVGHASGKLNPGVSVPAETLKSYASALEEARADLVALYFLMDEKLVELGLMESLEVGKSQYDGYIRNGLMTQMQRLNLGDDIEEAHMRNRQLVAAWAYEKGLEDNVIEKIVEDGKTYFVINDYESLKGLFGDLLREIQRIKSEGDFEAGRDLIEDYAVKVNPEIHKEVLDRVSGLDIAPYSGFVNPEYEVIEDENGEITDIKIVYPTSFKEQMLNYSERYSFLK